MVFSSILFLFCFLPIVLVCYYLLPARFRNGFLLLASLVFYAFGEPRCIWLLLASGAGNYVLGLQIDSRQGCARKRWLLCGVGVNVGVLAVFKYAGFLVSAVNQFTGASLPVPDISLPLGISFYTFQGISYLADVYRRDVPAQKSFPRLALYLTMFPQLVAGPIVRYRDVTEQIDRRACSLSMTASGMERLILGLSKKVLLADSFGVMADHAFSLAADALTTGTAWLGVFSYTMQIYFDFSAYSDMAIGLGRMLGFRFQENFDHPYCAGSIAEFWRRWHISLSGWFRDYVYIPLGGSRCSARRNIVNLLTVWLLTGLWHGAAWNFVLWGLYYGCLLLLERAIKRMPFRIPAFFRHAGTMLAVALGWVLFRIDSLSQLPAYLQAMFCRTGALWDANTLLYLHDSWPLMILSVFVCTPLPHRLLSRLEAAEKPLPQLLYWGILFALFFLCVMAMVNSTYSPFLYFRF